MKKTIFTCFAFLLVSPIAAFANHDYTYDYARVIEVNPIYRHTGYHGPQRRCSRDNHHRYRKYDNHQRKYDSHHSSLVPTIVGAVIGGAIGDNLSHTRKGKNIGRVAGAVVGGVIAHEVSHENNGRNEYTRCNSSTGHHHRKSYIDGYQVIYRYNGETFSTYSDVHPGRKIRVRIDVTAYPHGH